MAKSVSINSLKMDGCVKDTNELKFKKDGFVKSNTNLSKGYEGLMKNAYNNSEEKDLVKCVESEDEIELDEIELDEDGDPIIKEEE